MATLATLPDQFVEYLLCRLIRAAGGVPGRIRMQKALYLLGAQGRPLFSDFFIHRRGPYSPALANTLALLVQEDLLKEKPEQLTADPDVVQYRYSLSHTGEKALKSFEAMPGVRQWEKLGMKYERMFVQLANRNVRELELAATVLYWTRNGYTWDEAVKITADLKASKPSSPEFQCALDVARKVCKSKRR